MMRHSLLGMVGTVLLAAFCSGGSAAAEPAAGQSRAAFSATPSNAARLTDVSAQSREIRSRRPRRVRIYTPRGPGPNSVRICHSHYEYEQRVSGTVIVPRVNCHWEG